MTRFNGVDVVELLEMFEVLWYGYFYPRLITYYLMLRDRFLYSFRSDSNSDSSSGTNPDSGTTSGSGEGSAQYDGVPAPLEPCWRGIVRMSFVGICSVLVLGPVLGLPLSISRARLFR